MKTVSEIPARISRTGWIISHAGVDSRERYPVQLHRSALRRSFQSEARYRFALSCKYCGYLKELDPLKRMRQSLILLKSGPGRNFCPSGHRIIAIFHPDPKNTKSIERCPAPRGLVQRRSIHNPDNLSVHLNLIALLPSGLWINALRNLYFLIHQRSFKESIVVINLGAGTLIVLARSSGTLEFVPFASFHENWH